MTALTATAAATEAHVTVATIRAWCRNGVVAATKTAGRWVIDTVSLARRLEIGARRRARNITCVQPNVENMPANRRGSNAMWDDTMREHHASLMAGEYYRYDDSEGDAYEIIRKYGRWDDPENCTDEDLKRRFGKNWLPVVTVIRQAAALTREQAERMATPAPMAEHELDWYIEKVEEATGRDLDTDPLWDVVGEAGDEATDPMWTKGDTYWQNRMAYLAVLMAATLGDEIPEKLHSQMTETWNAAF
ncbi:hypothetical protein ACIP93_32905 [Streptomyces sp. NPDC088745]|uniref:hypothetical protein n=1 Tax=Streptomyces sp. NPDC088745 TaxID=3365884 RepID=UPI0038045913